LDPTGTEGIPPGPAARGAAPPPVRADRASAAVLAASLGMVLCVGVADHLTGLDVGLILFYLAPIGFGTWFADLRAGLVLSAAAVVVSMTADALHRAGAGAADLALPVLAWNGIMQAGASVALVLVLAALRARLESEERLARTDALTRIWNRRAFFEAAALEIERARRHGRPLTSVYVDCDDFKDVNDRRGHAEGDALLVSVARTLRAETRVVDAVARLGGDEFGLLLPETGAADAEALLGRVREALLAAMARNGWRVGFSIGAATFLAPPASVDELMARADELMYAAKRERKGTVRVGVFPGAARPPRGDAVVP
jgi:diguanylate cyclase (GGDEF)-like protein